MVGFSLNTGTFKRESQDHVGGGMNFGGSNVHLGSSGGGNLGIGSPQLKIFS